MSLVKVKMISTYGRLLEGETVEVDTDRAAALLAEGRAVEPLESAPEPALVAGADGETPPEPVAKPRARRGRGGA